MSLPERGLSRLVRSPGSRSQTELERSTSRWYKLLRKFKKRPQWAMFSLLMTQVSLLSLFPCFYLLTPADCKLRISHSLRLRCCLVCVKERGETPHSHTVCATPEHGWLKLNKKTHTRHLKNKIPQQKWTKMILCYYKTNTVKINWVYFLCNHQNKKIILSAVIFTDLTALFPPTGENHLELDHCSIKKIRITIIKTNVNRLQVTYFM